MEPKKDKYKHCLMLYGFITLVALIKEYEEENNYEECQIILDAINETNNEYGLDMPTKFDNKAVEYFHKAFAEFGLTGDTVKTNLWYYMDQTEKIVNEISS